MQFAGRARNSRPSAVRGCVAFAARPRSLGRGNFSVTSSHRRAQHMAVFQAYVQPTGDVSLEARPVWRPRLRSLYLSRDLFYLSVSVSNRTFRLGLNARILLSTSIWSSLIKARLYSLPRDVITDRDTVEDFNQNRRPGLGRSEGQNRDPRLRLGLNNLVSGSVAKFWSYLASPLQISEVLTTRDLDRPICLLRCVRGAATRQRGRELVVCS